MKLISKHIGFVLIIGTRHIILMYRRNVRIGLLPVQARCQDFAKGGRGAFFLKVEKTASEVETDFSAEISNSKFFPRKNR